MTIENDQHFTCDSSNAKKHELKETHQLIGRDITARKDKMLSYRRETALQGAL